MMYMLANCYVVAIYFYTDFGLVGQETGYAQANTI